MKFLRTLKYAIGYATVIALIVGFFGGMELAFVLWVIAFVLGLFEYSNDYMHRTRTQQ